MLIRNPTDLGLMLRQARRDARMTQAELAAKAGVSTRWLIGIEKGKGSAELQLVFRLLAALGLVLSVTAGQRPSAEATAQADDPGAGHARPTRLADQVGNAEGHIPSIAEVMKKLAGKP